MQDLFKTSDGENLRQNSGEFETGGGDIKPIPANTQVLAYIDEIGWSTYMDDEYINVRWKVLQPAEYKNRVVFQKIRVHDGDVSKADKARRMLAAIDKNAGGPLAQSNDFSDVGLARLVKKTMVIKLQVWKISSSETDDGEEKTGNWVSAVSPRSPGVQASEAQEQAPAPEPAPAEPDDFDDDIPF